MRPGRLQQELQRLGRLPLLIIDEVGCIPFEAGAANLFFHLISARYERHSVIVTSSKPKSKERRKEKRVGSAYPTSKVRVSICLIWKL